MAGERAEKQLSKGRRAGDKTRAAREDGMRVEIRHRNQDSERDGIGVREWQGSGGD
jgi:hypothetical protein